MYNMLRAAALRISLPMPHMWLLPGLLCYGEALFPPATGACRNPKMWGQSADTSTNNGIPSARWPMQAYSRRAPFVHRLREARRLEHRKILNNMSARRLFGKNSDPAPVALGTTPLGIGTAAATIRDDAFLSQ